MLPKDLIKRIQEECWLDFESVIATPDIMGAVGRIGKILGPRGLMPNPKLGTVTFDVAKAVGEVKAGKVDYRVDKGGVIHAPIGKTSFGVDKLSENDNRDLLCLLIAAFPAFSLVSELLLNSRESQPCRKKRPCRTN